MSPKNQIRIDALTRLLNYFGYEPIIGEKVHYMGTPAGDLIPYHFTVVGLIFDDTTDSIVNSKE